MFLPPPLIFCLNFPIHYRCRSGGDIIKGDVIRRKEGVFERRGPRGRRAINIGNCLIIAEARPWQDYGMSC